jgi:putative transposase
MTRQNHYKGRKLRQRRKVDEGLVVSLVKRERSMHPRMGYLKLYMRLKEEFKEAGVRLGRDRFLEVMRRQGLLVEPLPRAPRTTMSRHSLGVYSNRFREKVLTGANQAWVSDITYLRTRDRFAYLHLLTDAWSRKIVGYHLGESLESRETLKALEKAIGELPAGLKPLHHSDRGCQYCCHEYVERLKAVGMEISMTETNHCAENALAERMNGILKQEYWLGGEFSGLPEAAQAVEEAVCLYNNSRPHRSLQFRTPAAVHQEVA